MWSTRAGASTWTPPPCWRRWTAASSPTPRWTPPRRSRCRRTIRCGAIPSDDHAPHRHPRRPPPSRADAGQPGGVAGGTSSRHLRRRGPRILSRSAPGAARTRNGHPRRAWRRMDRLTRPSSLATPTDAIARSQKLLYLEVVYEQAYCCRRRRRRRHHAGQSARRKAVPEIQRGEVSITLLSDSPDHYYKPAFMYVAFNLFFREELKRPERSCCDPRSNSA